MKEFSLNDTFDLIGGFWPPDRPDNVITGNLSIERGQPDLLVSPSFARLNDAELQASFESFGMNVEFRQIAALFGHTREGRCTLLHLFERMSDGLTDFSSRLQVSAAHWRVSAALMGLHIDSSEAECIDGAAFYLKKIHKWLPKGTTTKMTEEGISHFSPWKALQFFCFDSVSLDAQVICEIFARSTKSVPRIRILPHKPKSLDWFLSIGPRLENFFSLFMGTSVTQKRVQLFQGKDDGWLVRKTPGRSEKVNLQSCVRCETPKIAEGLEKWFAVPEEKRPVEKTVLGMIRKSSLYVETEFLGLAQALEGFGRIRSDKGLIPRDKFKEGLSKLKETIADLWGSSEIANRCSEALSSANEGSYAQKIKETYDLLTPDFSSQLLGDRSELIRKIVQTRNYFTHLGIRKGTAVVDNSKELFLFNQKLHAFLRCVMLIELGITEDALRKPILYQATRWT